ESARDPTVGVARAASCQRGRPSPGAPLPVSREGVVLMMKLMKHVTVAAIGLVLGLRSSAHADELRLATLAPSGSPWMAVLDKAQAEIKDKTGGRIVLKYFEGGSQGDERDFIQKIKLGQLDGAAVTAVGMSMIDESIRVLELPMMFNSAEEL